MSAAPQSPQSSGSSWNLWTVLGLALLAWVLYQARFVIMILIGSILLSAFLEPFVSRVASLRIGQRELGRRLGAVIVMVASILLLAGLVVSVVPGIWREAVEFSQSLPQLLDSARVQMQQFEQLEFIPKEMIDEFETEGARLMAEGGKLVAGWAFSQAMQVFQLITLLVIPIGAFYLLTDGAALKNQLLYLFPPRARERVSMVIEEGATSLSRYVRGMTAVILVAGVIHTIGFTIAGLPFSLILGIIAGFAEAVPFLGSMLVVLTVTIVGLSDDPKTALFGLGYYLIIGNQLANYVITPRLMSQNLDVHPFVIILAALVGSSLGGPVGAVVALPTAVVLQTLTKRLWASQEDAAAEEKRDSS